MDFPTNTMTSRGIVQVIFENAKDTRNGTWRYSFVKKFRDLFLQMTLADVTFIVGMLTTFLRGTESDARSRFRIAQLFSIMRNDRPNIMLIALQNFRGDIDGITYCLDKNEPLSAPTKKLLLSLFQTKADILKVQQNDSNAPTINSFTSLQPMINVKNNMNHNKFSENSNQQQKNANIKKTIIIGVNQLNVSNIKSTSVPP